MAAEKKTPSLFDPDAMMEAQKRNFEALASAGNIVTEGLRSYAERQVAMVRESMGHLWSELQTAGQKAPAAPSDQLERMRSAFEKVVTQVQDLGQHMLEVQTQAMTVLNECAAKNMEVLGATAPEVAALQQKAKNAFELASTQIGAVIDEMKLRMSTLEHETKVVAATAPTRKAAKPAATVPAPTKPAFARTSPSKPTAAEPAAQRKAVAAKKPVAGAKPKPS